MKIKRLVITTLFCLFPLTGCGKTTGPNTPGDSGGTYSVYWKNYNGSLLEADMVNEGEIPEYNGNTPIRNSDSNYTYTFAGWDKPIEPVYSNITFTATYNKQVNINNFVFTYNSTEDFYTFENVQCDTPENLVIPSSVNGKPVKGVNMQAIGAYKEVVIPDSVEFAILSNDVGNYLSDEFKLTKITMSKNLKEIHSNGGLGMLVPYCPNGIEFGLNRFRQMNLLEDDNGFYLARGDNPKGILVYSKNNVIDQAVEMVSCVVDLAGQDINFNDYPNLFYFECLQNYEYDAQTVTYDTYSSINTGDRLKMFGYRGTVNNLTIGKNLEYLNYNSLDRIENIRYGVQVVEPTSALLRGDNPSSIHRDWEASEINIDSDNHNFHIENNAIYSYDKRNLYYVSKIISNNYEINSNTKIIKECAFSTIKVLENVTFNEGLTEIEEDAFYMCLNLGDVVFPNSLAKVDVKAFRSCLNMFRWTIGTNFSFDDFNDHYAFYRRGGSVIEIINHSELSNEEIYSKNRYLSIIDDISDSHIYHDARGYYYYYADHAFEDDRGMLLLAEGKHIIRYDGVTQEVTIPSFEYPREYVDVFPGAFIYANDQLKRLIINGIYYYWASTEFVVDSIPSLEYLEINCEIASVGHISHLASLKDIKIGEGVTEIPQIIDCPKLEHLVLSSTVDRVSSWCFFFTDCPNFEFNETSDAYYLGTPSNPYYCLYRVKDATATSVNIHNDCKLINERAFSEFYHDGYVIPHVTSISLPSGLEKISALAFLDCKDVASITIPNSVTYIGSNAFAGCSSITSFEFTDNVTRLGDKPFLGCSSLQSITYRGSLANWVNYGEVHISMIKQEWYSILGGVYTVTEGEFAPVHLYLNGSSTKATSLNLGMDEIGGSYSYCVDLQNVVIHDHEIIGQHEFRGCTSLTTFTADASLVHINDYAFKDCTSLSTFNFQGTVQQWKAIALDDGWNDNCPLLTEIHCSNGVVTL